MEVCPFEVIGSEEIEDPKILAQRQHLGATNILEADASKFDPSEELRHAINTAISVGEPLLITGEPGTGKTQTAYYVAHKLKLGKVLHFQTKSDSTAGDLLYHFDTVRYFREAQLASSETAQKRIDKWQYVEERELYTAIKSANETGVPRVLLIDEVDKAPRDFPNDLLHEINQMNFKIREVEANGKMSNEVAVKEAGLKPLVFITSNSERRLPEPFLRRCVYHHIEFTESLLKRALAARVKEFRIKEEQKELIDLAIDRFMALRQIDLRKKPATGEFLIWLKVLAIEAETDYNTLKNKLDKSSDDLKELPYIHSLLLKDHGDSELVKNR